ncbi:lipoprotein, partial [Salmonella enterica subsp. enterica serovar Bareilly str. CFSAN000964]
MDSHSSCRPVKAKTRRSGFYEEVKLTDKPLSFGYSVVDSHSSCRPVKAKTRRSGFY